MDLIKQEKYLPRINRIALCHHTVNQTQAIDFKSDFNSEVKFLIDLILIAFFTVHVPYVL